MADATVSCNKCSQPFAAESFTAASTVLCPSCGTALTGFLFPALYRGTLSAIAPESLLTDSEASCFFHASKKAVVACEGCGRFLCGLCDLDWESRHLCSACLEGAKKKGSMKSLENNLLTASLLSILLWFVSFLTAPVILFLVVRYWNKPLSLTGRTKIRFVVAALVALAHLGVWGVVFFHLFSK
jgi:hypothetical protein